MSRVLLIFLLQLFCASVAYSQSFTIDDLIKLSSVSPKLLDNHLKKDGFTNTRHWMDYDLRKTSFYEKIRTGKKDSLTGRIVDLYNKEATKYFEFHTPSYTEFLDGHKRLLKAGFFHDEKKDISQAGSKLYQKKNMTVWATTSITDESLQYSFRLELREYPNPAKIRHAEDLLSFTSHEYLAGFFGEKNVKKDLYYFSDKELKKCTVLFGNSNRQAVFVWDDEDNLRDLSYILVSNVIPTVSAEKFKDALGLNKWELENGIYSGMSIKELLNLNQKDFEIYGSKSENAFMVKQENSGRLDFKKAAVMMSCNNCNGDRLFNRPAVNALEIAGENLPMYVYHIILFSAKR
ncbi:MAG TPA: hypothetical protein VI461_15560 [Chitinophagaceae bacterium]|nr:hypothetical protein [Chitinophagaceae bacterium]